MAPVREMGQVRPLRPDRSGHIDRLLDGEVRRVRPAVPERIEDQHAHAPERPHRLVGEAFRVRDVTQIAHAEAVHGRAPVRHGERQHLESRNPDGLERPICTELDVRACRAIGHALRRIEDIREARLEQVGADGVRPDDDVTLGAGRRRAGRRSRRGRRGRNTRRRRNRSSRRSWSRSSGGVSTWSRRAPSSLSRRAA